MTRVAILAYEGCLASEVAGLTDLLDLANRLSQRANGRGRKVPFSWRVLRIQARAVKTASGVALGSTRVRRPKCDVLVIPGADLVAGPRHAVRALRALWRELELVRESYHCGVMIAAIGSGAVLLAEAGVLDGRKASATGPLADVLARRYPTVKWDTNASIAEDDQVLTAGAVRGAYELGLRIIERYPGVALAQSVSQLVWPAPIHGKEAFPVGAAHNDSQSVDPLVLDVQRWLRGHFREQVRITEVARRFGVTTRKLRRLFQAATGDTLIAYLQKLRVEYARTLLGTTRLTLREVVRHSGYVDPSVFGELFRRYNQLTPTEYRKGVSRPVRRLG